MQKTLDYIETRISTLDYQEQIALEKGRIEEVNTIINIKLELMSLREVAHADKVAQDKLDFERRCKSC